MAPHGEYGAKVLVLKESPEGIPEGEIGMAFGKGHTGGFFRHRRDDVRVERHDRHPLAEEVQAQ